MHALHIKALTKTYRGNVVALKGVDLDVEQGDFFALLGPNGAGKTTLIGIVTALVDKTSGRVSVFDHDIDEEHARAKSCIGIVPQEFNFNIFESVRDVVITQAGYYGLPRKLACQRAEIYLKQLELWDKRDTQVRMLSGGMKRRLMIARAMMHEPRLLILDEPTAGVDIEIRRSMWAFLRQLNEQGTTIILTTHYLEEAESLCKNIAIIDHGEIIERASMRQLLQKLHVETFVLNLENPVTQAPDIEGYSCRLVDPCTLEVDVLDTQDINGLFVALTAHNIVISSMRNKANRLEELFISLTSKEPQQ